MSERSVAIHLSAPHLNHQKSREEVQKSRERIKELGPGIITGGPETIPREW